MIEEICGTCKHHKHIYTHVDPGRDGISPQDGWVCINESSENAGCYTDYADKCDEWEEK